MSREIIKVNLRINLPLDANNYVKSEMIVSKEFTIKSFEAKNSSSWKISCNPHYIEENVIENEDIKPKSGLQIKVMHLFGSFDFDLFCIFSLIERNAFDNLNISSMNLTNIKQEIRANETINESTQNLLAVNDTQVQPILPRHDFAHQKKWEQFYQFSTFFSYESLYANKETFFPNGELLIQGTIVAFNSVINLDAISPIQCSMHEDFESLFNTMKDADAIIMTKDNMDLNAHSVILSARSEKISRMISNGNRTIGACEYSSDTVTEFLRYIYCHKISKLWLYNIDLYRIAKKFAIRELPDICYNSFYETLYWANSVDIACLAIDFDLKELMFCCVLIIKIHFKTISSSKKWKNLVADKKIKIFEAMVGKHPPNKIISLEYTEIDTAEDDCDEEPVSKKPRIECLTETEVNGEN